MKKIILFIGIVLLLIVGCDSYSSCKEDCVHTIHRCKYSIYVFNPSLNEWHCINGENKTNVEMLCYEECK